ncbi:glycerophosphodiester phosphodiesterase [Peribacillus sp. SCS-26]|uniref:glycerophosphodiester phosphodiesterase n=1 Tax=Paraperibacillus marinus TaxID=3115295 RepID=UPI00390696DE
MTQIFAHRGSAGTHPENTMISFTAALASGAEGIELDVQLTRDGKPVIIHDEKVDRTTDGRGYVRNMTLSEIKKLNASHSFQSAYGKTDVPSLAEFLDWFKDTNLICNIELKNGVFLYPGMEEKVIEMIRRYGFEERIIISSFNHYSIVHCHMLAPEIEVAPLYSNGLYMPWVYAKAIGGRGIHPSIKTVNASIIRDSMAAGIAVRPYTINNEAQMENLFRMRCSAIITDFPAAAAALREKLRGRAQ